MRRKVIVVGGGAAGLMAAGSAAESGAEVLLLEKMKRPAQKIRISGKGRCNLSNSADRMTFISHFTQSGRFLHQSFDRFFTEELIAFFESRGLSIQKERGGRLFPSEGGGPAVAELMIRWVRQAGGVIRTEARVSEVLITEKGVEGVICNGKKLYADQVILATGGASYPRTGSTGEGYKIAETIGHTIIPIRPSLISMAIGESLIEGDSCVELKNVNVRVYINGKRKGQTFGELTLSATHLGGPVILTKSLLMVDSLHQGKTVTVRLDLKPALDDAKLDSRLQRDLQKRAEEPMRSVMRGLIPRELVRACLENAAIAPARPAKSLSSRERKAIRTWLKNIAITVTDHSPIEEAIVTAGGVKTSEIYPRTMESRIIPRLYVVGELLDIQGDTGGYNLQAAFSTGWLAGKSAAD